MKYESIRRQVLAAIVKASELGLIHGTSGNISVRDPEDGAIAITPSGRPYDTMKAEDIAIVDLSGKWLDGPYKPSSETPMHTAVFRTRPDVGACVHTHGMFCTVMAMSGEELLPSTPPHAEFAPIRVVPFQLPGSIELAEAVRDTLMGDRAVIMKNHGMFCVGKDIESAITAAVYVEECAQIAYYSKLLGCFSPLSGESVREIKDILNRNNAV